MRVEISHYTKVIKGITVLDDINLALEPGTCYGLRGKNGSGKTMLLRAIAGLLFPTSGGVFVDGKKLGKDIDFPDSIVAYFEGMMGQPEGGFPEKLQKLVLKDKQPITCRPGELLPDEDFDKIKAYLRETYGIEGNDQEALSYALYPKVFEDYQKGLKKEGNFRFMGSDTFFYGLRVGETSDIKIAEGKILTVKLIEVKELDEEGFREVVFEVNGNRRTVSIKDQGAKAQAAAASVVMADPDNEKEIGANIPGTILKVLVKEGEKVEANQPIAVIEAMKMETNILAPVSGEVDKIYVNDAQQVKSGELIATLK